MSATIPSRPAQRPESKPREAAAAGPSEMGLPEQARATFRELARLVAELAEAEERVERTRSSNDSKIAASYEQGRRSLQERLDQWEREETATDEQRRRAAVEAGMRSEAAAKNEFAGSSRIIASDFDRARETARKTARQVKQEATRRFEEGQEQVLKDHAEASRPLDDLEEMADGHRARLETIAADYAKMGVSAGPVLASEENHSKFSDPAEELFDRLSHMGQPLELLEGLLIPRSLKGGREAWVPVVIAGSVIGAMAASGATAVSLVIGAVAGAALSFAARMALFKLSKDQVERLRVPLASELASADNLARYCRGTIDERLKVARLKLASARDEEHRRADADHARALRAAEAERDERLRQINEVYAARVTDARTSQQRELREAIADHERRAAEFQAQKTARIQKLEDRHHEYRREARDRHESAWNDMARAWRDGVTDVAARLDALGRVLERWCPAWDGPDWLDRPLANAVPPVLRMGTVPVDLAGLPGGAPADPRLSEGLPARFVFPAMRDFPARAGLWIEAPPEGRSAAIAALQASMFRLLASLPPGQARFTIVDPIGIGRNFGAFMHLADHDTALVNGQVWTDPRQIEERLADLTAHMEMITQKYLRNEYATIEEYNAIAGEIAEPYRVLAIADYPARFDEKSAARLASIAAGGVPCGVFVLIAADPTKPPPDGCPFDEVRENCERLEWDGARLAWRDEDFGALPIALEPFPPAEPATRRIHRIGAAAREAKRVEVPFEFIAPEEEGWWLCDSREGLDVPLGKSGATKRQHLALGHGTSQHVLIAGRTGSGKSTLMHALITNLALNYSPDELDLYLIDFKKGVEFKVYATHGLPHASVVAIESEREFGLSVLQRLDAELRLRADRFREAGVQDVRGFRNAPGSPPLPRILLVVDEFQEFFSEEDKLAQEAASWLDRLVRQGRAFGIHVLLGSQSLSGAMGLGRSTLGQMAVRIALQCSEADAHLILSETNAAPKMLTRPGEAIYNDANGAPEGNHFFQVVWLSDELRESYLDQLGALAERRPPALARSPIVFEGDAPADLAQNPSLRELLAAEAWPDTPRSAPAWVGDAIAIKPPTAALFRRLGGNHLLIVGQNEEAALGTGTAVFWGLAAQYAPPHDLEARSGARFFVLDGTPEDHPDVDAFARAVAPAPHGAQVGRWRDAAPFLAEIAAEIERRQSPGADGPEIFLFIHDLPRFRDLRRREDEFSFSRRDDGPGPLEHLDLVLREGPALGVHLIVWCDTVNNLNRHFNHQDLREFDMRVLFQMSPNDSGHMLDTPAASKLGRHRALFHGEEQNLLEKFRPYGAPRAEWLRATGERLAARNLEK